MARQSALHHWATQAGASFTEHDGWQMPARFSDAREEAAQVVQSAGLADVSHQQLASIGVPSVFSQFLLAGPRSRDILSKLTSLNVSDPAFPNGASGQSSLAHVRAMLLRQDLPAVPAFLLLVTRDYGEFVWEAVLHAGHEFHLKPFGLEALAMLEAAT